MHFSAHLRSRAEQLLSALPMDESTLPTADVQSVFHELSVYQVELEIQNEELRYAQLELAETRDRYADLYESAPVGYLTLDDKGMILEANLTLARMLDVERGGLLRSHLEKFMTPEGQDDWYRHRRAAWASGVKETCELELFRSDKTAFTARLESVATEEGSACDCLTAVIDITRSKQAEAALQRLNIRLDAELQGQVDQVKLLTEAVSHLGDGVLITSDHVDWPDSRIVFANEAMSRICGHPAADLIGQTPRMLETGKKRRSASARTALPSSHGSFQSVHRHRDGTSYETEITLTPIFDALGHRTHFVSIHRDITERNQVETALRQSEQALADFFAEASVGLLIVDPGGVIRRANAVAAVLLDKQGHLEGFDLPDFFADAGVAADFVRRLGEGEVLANERAQVGVGTSLRHVLIDANARWKGDVQHHSRWFLRDITDRVELEREVLTISAREQERFAHDLHDDLCQRLTGIEFMAQSLAADLAAYTGPGSELAQRIGGLARDAVEQGRQLARDLSPLTTGEQGLVPALRDLAGTAGRQFNLRCEYEGPDTIDLDDRTVVTQLYRIAQGAISNAVRHACADRIEIVLQSTPQCLKLSISDDGIGLPELHANTPGFGLRLMQHRAHLIDSSFTARARKAGGTEILCTLRLKPDAGKSPGKRP